MNLDPEEGRVNDSILISDAPLYTIEPDKSRSEPRASTQHVELKPNDFHNCQLFLLFFLDDLESPTSHSFFILQVWTNSDF